MITNDGKSIIGKYLINQAPSYAGYLAVGCGSDPDNYQSSPITQFAISGSTVTVTATNNFVVNEPVIVSIPGNRFGTRINVASANATTFTYPYGSTLPAITGVVSSANVVTYTTATAHGLRSGDRAYISNITSTYIATEIFSTTGTIGTVTSNTATITNMSSTTGFYVGQPITATAGTGNFGSGTMTVTSILSSTSINVSSTLTFTAGTVTNIRGTTGATINVLSTTTFSAYVAGSGSATAGDQAGNFAMNFIPPTNSIAIRDYANKKTLDYEMFRVPIVSRAFDSQSGSTQVILAGELPTQDRYLMTEAAVFSSGTNPIASLSDSRSLYSFSEGEGWENHNVTATAITTFTATSIANVNGVINSGNGTIANLTAFALESTDAMFDSDSHKSTNSKPRLLSNFIVVRGDLSEINTTSTTWTAVNQPHIHIQNQRFGFGVNSSIDQLKLAFSVINRNPMLTANAAVAPDNAYIMIEFSDSENQTDGILSTTGTIGTVSGTGPYTANITGMSSTNGFYVGQLITATAGTGSFGAGVMTVTSIVSETSINISSTATFTAGTITNNLGTAVGVSNNQYARMQVALSSTDFANVNGSRYFVSTKTLGELATSAGFSWEAVKLVKVYVEVDAPASLDNTVTYKEATGGGSTKTVRLGLGTQPHKFEIGDFVTVTGVDSTFNGTYVINDEKHTGGGSNNWIEYKIISGTIVSNTAATGNVTFSRANYYVLFDGLRFENIADLELNPLYGMTAYTTLNDLDTFSNSVSTRVPITKDVNTNTLLEFRLNLELNAEG